MDYGTLCAVRVKYEYCGYSTVLGDGVCHTSALERKECILEAVSFSMCINAQKYRGQISKWQIVEIREQRRDLRLSQERQHTRLELCVALCVHLALSYLCALSVIKVQTPAL